MGREKSSIGTGALVATVVSGYGQTEIVVGTWQVSLAPTGLTIGPALSSTPTELPIASFEQIDNWMECTEFDTSGEESEGG
jgi:hypothetical protein